MIDAPLAFALTLGMVATVNPCGFAMLPAYLSYFVGVDAPQSGDAEGTRGSVLRALVVSAAVTAGFAATFGVIGLVVAHVTREVYEIGPWVSLVIGVALAGLG
ncbi:MAG: cytochrome c biogenesis CcdA family protein, partial [Acidimicrobiales bacterium]